MRFSDRTLISQQKSTSPPAAPFSTLCTWSPNRELAAWITLPAVSCNALGIFLRRVMSTRKVGNLQSVSSGRITFTLNSLSGRVLLGTQRLEGYCQLKQLTTMFHTVLRMIPQTVSVSSFSFRGQNKLWCFMTSLLHSLMVTSLHWPSVGSLSLKRLCPPQMIT